MNIQVYFYPQWAYASVLENASWDDLFHHQGMIMLTNRERNRHPAPFVASQESYIGRLTCYYNLLLQPSKDDSSYTLNQHLKPVVNFRINTVQMMLINRCSFITFTFRMMGSDIIKIIIQAANINDLSLCVRHCSKHFKSHSKLYKIVYRQGK